MDIKERAYSVLQVSASEKFNSAFAQFLSGSGIGAVKKVTSCSAAQRVMAERSFDIIIINTPLPDENGLRLAIDASEKSNAAVLLLVRSEVYDELLPEMTGQGVYMLPKPTSSPLLRQAMDWLMVTRELRGKLEKKTSSLSEKMDEIRIVNRAKLELVSRRGMTEAEAHHFIERQAMNRCVTRRVIAQELIREAEAL